MWWQASLRPLTALRVLAANGLSRWGLPRPIAPLGRERYSVMQAGLNLKSVIAVTTGLAASYLTANWIGLRPELILTLYGDCVLAMIWMVIQILKDPYSTDRTFDDYFYQDRPDIRRTGKE
jgi:hypothetical protein